MSTLNISRRILAFEDAVANNNPMRRSVDWSRSVLGVPVEKPSSVTLFVDPLTEVSIFDGARVLTTDNLSEFALSLSLLATDRYRLAWTGTGAAPGFRTDRGLTLSGGDLTITLQANQTAVVTHTGGAVFGAVVAGDVLFIPGVTTGDTALFDSMNEGFWTVLAANASQLTVARTSGTVFEGLTETVTVASDDQVQAFSSAGVQVGDTLELSAGFVSTTRRTYQVVEVTSGWVEFYSSLPLAAETAVPTIAGLGVYTDAKRYFFLETDQEVAVKLNGETDETTRVEPWLAANDSLPGSFEKTGIVFSCSVKNRSTARAKITVITAQ